MTGIANRRMFNYTVEKEWARALRTKSSLALIFIDIDHFKQYNDYYGHQQGDHCLNRVAQAISLVARRKTDLAARYGVQGFPTLKVVVGKGEAQD